MLHFLLPKLVVPMTAAITNVSRLSLTLLACLPSCLHAHCTCYHELSFVAWKCCSLLSTYWHLIHPNNNPQLFMVFPILCTGAFTQNVHKSPRNAIDSPSLFILISMFPASPESIVYRANLIYSRCICFVVFMSFYNNLIQFIFDNISYIR